MCKTDGPEYSPDTTAMLTDFPETLNLRARKKDMCSIDNHAVLDIFCVECF